MNNLFFTDASHKVTKIAAAVQAPITNTTDTQVAPSALEAAMANPNVASITVATDGTLTLTMASQAPVASETELFLKSAVDESLHIKNKTGFRGVSIRGSKYRADISHNGVQKNLGSYDTFGEAVEARMLAEVA